jgi:transposase
MRLGWFRPVHCKSMAAQEVRALLTARKLVQSKLFDVEMSLRGILRGFGLKVGPTTSPRFAGRIRELVTGQATLEVIAAALLWRSTKRCGGSSTASSGVFGRWPGRTTECAC